MVQQSSRRSFLKTATAISALGLFPTKVYPQIVKPTVAIARCKRYDFEVVKNTFKSMFEQIGGVPALVNQKWVSVKVNLTSYKNPNVYTIDPVHTIYTHPIITLAACSLFEDYGASKIIICESLPTRDHTLTAFKNNGYDPEIFQSHLKNIEFENTRNLGTGTSYKTLKVGNGAYLYESFDLNYRYVDTDVMVSIAKMKNHDIAGITLSMKNLFGITPNSIYGGAGTEPDENHTQVRGSTLHNGSSRVGTDGEIRPVNYVGQYGKRVPRVIVDIVRSRPIDLGIIDAITSMSGGEGPWNGLQIGLTVPNLVLASRDALALDSVGTAVMGFDPQALGFTKPFYNGDNQFELAAAAGMGINRLDDIEVAGLSIQDARYAYIPGKDHQ